VGHAVQITTLDAYAAALGIAAFDLIKLDVEGSEWDVLRGAANLLGTEQRPLLLIEVNGQTAANFGYRPLELFNWLASKFNYAQCLTWRHGGLVELPCAADARHGEMMLLAHPEQHTLRLRRLLTALGSAPGNPHGAAVGAADVRMLTCPVCTATASTEVHRLRDDRYGVPGVFRVHRCLACGLYFLAERYTTEQLRQLYATYYASAPHNAPRLRSNRPLSARMRSGRIWGLLSGGVDLVGRVRTGERVLDVGCGYASARLPIQARGARWTGLDLDPKVCRALRTQGLEVVCGRLEDLAPADTGGFDTILMNQVLEHCPTPVETLCAARRCLAPQGRILLSCPNADSRFLISEGKRWLHWHVPFHQVQLSRSSLTVAVQRAGLRIEEMWTVTPPPWFLAQRRHSSGAQYRMRAEPLRWLLLAPWIYLGDTIVKRDGGDAMLAVLRPD
jgi:SAM-dependent methyltransferase